MLGELALRFVIGGVVVSAFSVIGEVWKPKTFSGIFGAAPSVAIGSLALAYDTHGDVYAAVEGRSLILGGLAMIVYAACCMAVTKWRACPVWLAAACAWAVWFAAAFAMYGVATSAGILK